MPCSHLSFFPAPIDGETVYSWLCRYHIWSGHQSFRRHSLAVFGVKESQVAAEFPSFLKPLSILTEVDISWIIQHMTTCHYYQPFLTHSRYEGLERSIAQGTTFYLRSQLSLVANRLNSGRELWCCPLCIANDKQIYGFPIWHIEHQLTGCVSCLKHHHELIACNKIRSKAFLPSALGVARSSVQMDNYTQLVIDAFNYHSNLSINKVLNTYQYRLRELGILTNGNRLRLKVLKLLIIDKLSGLAGFSEYQYLLKMTNKQYPECLFYNSEARHHPLKHLVFIAAIFGTWKNFITLYYQLIGNKPLEKVSRNGAVKRSNITLSDSARHSLNAGDSLRSVSRDSGTSVGTLKILAQQEGIYINTRPYKIFPEMETAIWHKLVTGLSCRKIAKSMAVSVGAVEQILRKDQNLIPLRETIRFEKAQLKCRREIVDFCVANPNKNRKQLREECGTAFAWLYRHDKNWLYENLPAQKK